MSIRELPTRILPVARAVTVAATLAALGATACSTGPEPVTKPPADAAGDPAGLLPGDAIQIRVWRDSTLTGSYSVDDRGIVALPLLGNREVAGMVPEELRRQLLEDYAEYVRDPAIEVTILRRVNILGAVMRPGLYPVDATISLAEALAIAGGITPEGDADDVRLIRDGRVIEQDLDRATRVGEYGIRSGDHIVVAEKGWLERNPGALIGSLIGALAGVTVALIR